MKTSQAGINLIKKFEGLRLQAYKPVQAEKFYTIGYGHYGADVSPNMSISADEAEELLKKDLQRFETAVNETKRATRQSEFDALVSFAYNCGAGNMQQLVKDRSTLQIADAMLLYTKASGQELPGLVNRRKAERALFLDDLLNEVAMDVIRGRYGNNDNRREALARAGYDYDTIQARVNKILKDR